MWRAKNSDGYHCLKYAINYLNLKRIWKTVSSITFLQPLFQYLAVFVGLFDEAGVTCAFEDFPAAVGDVLVERGGHHGSADVAGAAADEAGLRNFVQTVGVFEIGQIA